MRDTRVIRPVVVSCRGVLDRGRVREDRLLDRLHRRAGASEAPPEAPTITNRFRAQASIARLPIRVGRNSPWLSGGE